MEAKIGKQNAKGATTGSEGPSATHDNGRSEVAPGRDDGKAGDDASGAVPTISGAIQDHLGRRLRAGYDDLVNQPVPDRFRQLLEELERQEKKQ